MKTAAARLTDQRVDPCDQQVGRGRLIAVDVVEPDIAERALLPIAPMGHRQLVPMAFRPQPVHGVHAVEDGHVTIERQAVVGGRPKVCHRKV